MKEATGELNMTVIVVIAIAAVAGLFYMFVWPMIQLTIANQTCKTYGDGYTAKATKAQTQDSDATKNTYQCCNGSNCVAMPE